MPRVSVLVLCYNKWDYTRRCIAALRANTSADDFELIVVDNASADETPRRLQTIAQGMPNIKVVRNKENLGFVGGNNRGAAEATGELLFFLNNDAEVQPGWLSPLVELFDRDSTVGAVGSKLIYPDGKLQEAGGIIFRDASGWNYGRNDQPGAPEYSYLREVDYCSGAALMVRTETFRKLGGFDTLFQPAYCEDTDLCFAMRSLGLRVLYQPRSEVIHHEGATAGTDTSSGFKKYQMINRPKFVKKWSAELARQPSPTSDMVYGRWASNRRSREGRQILVTADEMPQFDRQAGALTLTKYMQLLLDGGNHVTFVAHNTTWRGPDVDLLPYLENFRDRGILVHALDRIPDAHNWEEREREMGRILQARRYDAALLWSAREGRWFLDAIQKFSPSTRTVIDTGDLAFIREGRKAEREEDISAWLAFLPNKEIEMGVYRRADAVMVLTQAERALLGEWIPESKVAVVPDLYELQPHPPAFEDRAGLVFLAGFRHDPNIDAAIWLLDEIMPLVWRELPDVTITLLGADPPERLRRRAGDLVRVTGFVADIVEPLRQARVAVVPLRFGAGIKGKICQAMAAGTPNVTTSIGAMGMSLRDGETASIADTPEMIASAIVRLYRDKDFWTRVAQGASDEIARSYSQEAVRKELLAALIPPTASRATPEVREVDFHQMIGEAYRAMKGQTFALAEDIFRRAKDQEPNNPAPWIGLSRIALARDQLGEARAFLDEARARNGSPNAVYPLLADVLERTGQHNEAVQVLEEADQKGVGNPPIWIKLGQWYERRGKNARAAEYYEKSIQVDPSSIPAWLKLAEMYQRSGKEKEASAALEKLARMHSNADLWMKLAELEMQRMEWARAESAYTEAIRYSPEIPNGWAMRAAARSMLGLKRQALADYSHAAMLALNAHQPELACIIDIWMSAVAAGKPAPAKPKPDPKTLDQYYRLAKSLEETGKISGRPGPISTYELGEAMGLLQSVLSGSVAERQLAQKAAGMEEAFFAVTQLRLERAIEEGEGAIVPRLRGTLQMLSVQLTRDLGIDMEAPPPGGDAADPAKVDVIIPIYNNAHMTSACIQSVMRTEPDAHILLVDDASTDPRISGLLEEYQSRPNVEVIRREKNGGFVEACRTGAAVSTSEFILFLNSDIECIAPAWLEKMIPTDPQTAIVGARLLYPADSGTPWAGGIQHAGVARNALGQPYHPLQGQRGEHPVAAKAHQVNAVTGACLLVRREVWQELGGFDAAFGRGIYEDVDFCYRARAKGYRVWYQPAATLYHREHGSMAGGITLDGENEAKNRKTLFERWGNLPSDEVLFLVSLYRDEESGYGKAEEVLRALLEADDLPAALKKNEALLDANLLSVVQRDMESARREGQAELAAGLRDLVGYIEGVLSQKKQQPRKRNRA